MLSSFCWYAFCISDINPVYKYVKNDCLYCCPKNEDIIIIIEDDYFVLRVCDEYNKEG